MNHPSHQNLALVLMASLAGAVTLWRCCHLDDLPASLRFESDDGTRYDGLVIIENNRIVGGVVQASLVG